MRLNRRPRRRLPVSPIVGAAAAPAGEVAHGIHRIQQVGETEFERDVRIFDDLIPFLFARSADVEVGQCQAFPATLPNQLPEPGDLPSRRG